MRYFTGKAGSNPWFKGRGEGKKTLEGLQVRCKDSSKRKESSEQCEKSEKKA